MPTFDFSLLSAELPVKLVYDFKFCPSCGLPLPVTVLHSVVLDEPQIGFPGSGDESFDFPDNVACVRLLCDTCYDNAKLRGSARS